MLQTTKEITQKDRLNDLTADIRSLLTHSRNIPHELARRLNDRQMKTKRREEYTYAIVNNVLAGRTEDFNVEIVLTEWKAELQGKRGLIVNYLTAAQALLD